MVLISTTACHHATTMSNVPNEFQQATGVNWQSERYTMDRNSEMVYDGYSPEYVHAAFPRPDGIVYVSRPVDFYGFLWNDKLQFKLNHAITRTSLGASKNWRHRQLKYRFVAGSDLYYSPHNNKPCRMGTLYRENGGRTQAWDKVPSTFCKVGPKGEWLPMT